MLSRIVLISSLNMTAEQVAKAPVAPKEEMENGSLMQAASEPQTKSLHNSQGDLC